MLRIPQGWPSLKGLPCPSHISLHTQVIRARRRRRQILETAGWRSRDTSEPSKDLQRVPAQSTQGRCSDSAQVLRVQYYAPYTGAFAQVGDGNLDEEERKCGMLPKFITMPILLTEACGKAVHARSLSDTDRRARDYIYFPRRWMKRTNPQSCF
jgi:hypothetical protein